MAIVSISSSRKRKYNYDNNQDNNIEQWETNNIDNNNNNIDNDNDNNYNDNNNDNNNIDNKNNNIDVEYNENNYNTDNKPENYTILKQFEPREYNDCIIKLPNKLETIQTHL